MDRADVSRRGFLLGGSMVAAGLLTATVGTDTAWAVSLPPILDCAAWGARPNSAIVPIWSQRPVKILVHHTATPNGSDFSRAAAESLARSIQNFHMDYRRWIDTGQHFTVSRGGFLLEGRHRSLEMLRLREKAVQGAHCRGQNVEAVGIENEGIYTSARPPEQLWNRLRETCAYICLQYGIHPAELYGHRDYSDTACPGNTLYGLLPQLRSEVAAALGQPLPRHAALQAYWPLLRDGDRGPAVLAAQHLLRGAGMRRVSATGRFDEPTVAAVRRFQTEHGTEWINGVLGGQSWPLLVTSGDAHPSPDVTRAAQALTTADSASPPTSLQEWQELLTKATRA